jgi:glycosyltransferase involved in cell wall biosynthesis
MKVLFTMDALINAGTERSVLDLAKHFSADVEVHLAYFYPRHDLKKDYEAAGIQLHFMDLPGKYSFIQGIRKLNDLIKKEKPQLIVSSLMRANLICRIAAKLSGVPIIGTFVNESYGDLRIAEHRQKSYWKFKVFWLLDKWTAGIPVSYIANAQSIAESNSQALGIPLSKVKVIYRGREISNFAEWKAPSMDDDFHFTAIGRLLERKGYRELIDAFGRINAEYPHTRLHIYGEGAFRKKLEQQIKAGGLSDFVKLHGAVPNAWQELYASHCFVFPSWYEGFSGALVEAMMVGLPIIASDIPMNLEAVTHNQTALIHQVRNTDDLYAKMKLAISDYPSVCQLGQTSRQISFQRFDIKNIAKEYEAELRKFALTE